MATSTFTGKGKQEMKAEISTLLGRGIGAFPCPLTDDEITEFWNSTIPPEFLEHYVALKAANFNMRSLESGEGRIYIHGLGEVVRLIIHSRSEMLVTPAEIRRRMPGYTSTSEHMILSAEEVRRLHPAGHKLTEWCELSAGLLNEAVLAYNTLCAVIEMCSTVGQLRRMVPDLVDYLSVEKQAVIREQQRASSLPAEWAAYPREPVHAALCTCAKFHLLRAVPEFKLHATERWHNTRDLWEHQTHARFAAP